MIKMSSCCKNQEYNDFYEKDGKYYCYQCDDEVDCQCGYTDCINLSIGNLDKCCGCSGLPIKEFCCICNGEFDREHRITVLLRSCVWTLEVRPFSKIRKDGSFLMEQLTFWGDFMPYQFLRWKIFEEMEERTINKEIELEEQRLKIKQHELELKQQKGIEKIQKGYIEALNLSNFLKKNNYESIEKEKRIEVVYFKLIKSRQKSENNVGKMSYLRLTQQELNVLIGLIKR